MHREAYGRFIEQAADMIEEHGLPPMAGRVIGALLVCSPPHRSLDELAEDIRASRGAISMATQLLIRLGFIERISLPAARRHFYRLRPWFLQDLMSDRTDHLLRHQSLFKAGIELLRDEPIKAKARLIELQAYMDFLVEELPGLRERWMSRRDALMGRRIDEMT